MLFKTLEFLLTALNLQCAVLFIQGIPPEIHHTCCSCSYPNKEDISRDERIQEILFKILICIWECICICMERKIDGMIVKKEGVTINKQLLYFKEAQRTVAMQLKYQILLSVLLSLISS